MGEQDINWLRYAEQISNNSKDPSTKVGAVIVDTYFDENLGEGWNGFAQGVRDTEERWNDRLIKYDIVLHAEENAILFSEGRNRFYRATLYTWPFPPCSRCAAKIIQVGIRRVVSLYPTEDQLARWAKSFRLAKDQYKETGVDLRLIKL